MSDTLSGFLPSLLEYSVEELRRKCLFIQQHKATVLDLTHQQTLSLHLDSVLPEFAKSRAVMTSLSIQTVLDVLAEFFQDQPLILSIHLMGETEDMIDVYKVFEQYNLPKHWQITILVSETSRLVFETLFANKKHVNVGTWLDLSEWGQYNFQPKKDYLLMTVLAGKSGQIRKDIDKNAVVAIAKKNAESKFIVDGGWLVDEQFHQKNMEIVSYSSFWKAIGYK